VTSANSSYDTRIAPLSPLSYAADTIRKKFDTCRFADHKKKVIDPLMCVTRVSVETRRVTEAVRAAKR
jgi:hypothetical protein